MFPKPFGGWFARDAQSMSHEEQINKVERPVVTVTA